MYDNKVRLSPDVIEKAEQIAAEWGLKNARAAVEAVFRRYCDDYLNGRDRSFKPTFPTSQPHSQATPPSQCEALSELDDLLNL